MLKREEYIRTVRRSYPPLFASTFMHGYKNPRLHKPFLFKKYAMVDLIVIDGEWYYPKKQLDMAGKLVFDAWYSQKNLNRIIKLWYNKEQALIKASKGSFKEYATAYEAYIPSILLVWAVEGRITDRMMKLLRRKLDQVETEKLMDVLNIPLQDNFYKLEERDLILSKNLQTHVKKYEWINSRFGEIKPYTIAEARKKLKHIDRKKFLKDWNEQKMQVRKAIFFAKSLLPTNDRVLVDFMQFIIWYRTQRTDIVNMSHYLYRNGLKLMANQKGISYEELLYCTKDEILGKLPSKAELKERIKMHATVMDHGKIYCASGKAYEKIKKWFAEDTENVQKLSGSIACVGNAKGKVRLIFSSKDFSKMKTGDILITSMTNPHMVPIMKKAAAFVTDEGGITCHAAIMAREMKKPCVIGTKFATKVFRDGDMVEVDANNGIVRKI